MTKDIDQKTGLGKVCTKCGEWKLLEEFRLSKSGNPRGACRACDRKAGKEYRNKDIEAAKRREAKSRNKNRDKRIEESRRYLVENREKERLRSAEYNEKNRQKRRDYAKDRVRKLKEADPDWGKKLYRKNRDGELERAKARREVPHIRMHASMSRAIAHCLRKGGKSGETWLTMVGYSREDLMAHLESKFLPGMTWDNYGKDGWEIDHIIPKSLYSFKTKDDIEFKKCWSLENLQPLWLSDNRRKHTKLPDEIPNEIVGILPQADNDNLKKGLAQAMAREELKDSRRSAEDRPGQV